jgi:membrane-associated phospholipid phosphatase
VFLKSGLGRARPELWLEYKQYGFYWFKFTKMYWSFPSSHATTIMGLLIGLSLLFPRTVLFSIIPALLIMSSRVLLYQHFVSDILTAIYLTLIESGILVYCLREQKWFLKATKGV